MKLPSPHYKRWRLWWPTAAVLVVGGALSAGMLHSLKQWQSETLKERMEQQANLFTFALEQRLHSYAAVVQSMQPLFELPVGDAKDALLESALVQQMPQRYPGVQSLSFARRTEQPDATTQQDERYTVERVWPAHADSPKVGVDVYQHQLAALDVLPHFDSSKQAAMSAPFHDPHQRRGTELFISVPVHKLDGQGGELQGFASIKVNLGSMLTYMYAKGMGIQTLLSIQDMGLASEKVDLGSGAKMVFLAPNPAVPAYSAALIQREINILGRVWRLDFAPKSSVLSNVERIHPWLLAGGGLAATVLLAAIVGLVSRQRWRAELQTRASHNLLRQRTDRYKALFHQAAVGVCEVEAKTGRFVHVNHRFCDIAGYAPQSLEQMDIYAVIHAEDSAQLKNFEADVAAGRKPHYTCISRLIRSDGVPVWVEVWVSPLLAEDGRPLERHIAMVQDVTERQTMQGQLQAREAYSGEMLRYMPVGLVVVGPEGEIEFANHQFEVMTGWRSSEFDNESTLWRNLCANPKQHATLLQRLNVGRCQVVATGMNMPADEYLLRNKEGQEIPVEVSGRFLGGRILLTLVDLSQRKAAEAKIQWLGFYDTLTQLPNRRMLLDRLGEALARCMRNGHSKMALLLLDIDNFKALNETLGHQHGDALLRMVATRLENCIADKHTLARQGGDEFAVVLEDLPQDSLEAARHTEQVGRTVLEALRAPFDLGGQDLHVTVSMGAVVSSGPSDSVEELLKRADLALYQAKSAGRDTLQFFDPSMQKAVSARVEMEKDLRLALDRHEFDLYYQPQVQHDKVVGAEALLRWRHPVKGLISPSIFVPAAEESGLILPLGEWVLYAACRQLAHWAQSAQFAHLTMSVNVSPRQFYQSDFVQQVQQALRVTGAKPHLLELELTEGMLLTDVEDTIDKMVQLKEIGVIFSLDDFGTGYSSLSYLKRLPLNKLKIDQSFVREVTSSANDATIARTIVALGHSLGLQVIAEGVETVEQRDFLAASGCRFWQGFLFSRPAPVAEFERWSMTYQSAAAEGAVHA